MAYIIITKKQDPVGSKMRPSLTSLTHQKPFTIVARVKSQQISSLHRVLKIYGSILDPSVNLFARVKSKKKTWKKSPKLKN